MNFRLRTVRGDRHGSVHGGSIVEVAYSSNVESGGACSRTVRYDHGELRRRIKGRTENSVRTTGCARAQGRACHVSELGEISTLVSGTGNIDRDHGSAILKGSLNSRCRHDVVAAEF